MLLLNPLAFSLSLIPLFGVWSLSKSLFIENKFMRWYKWRETGGSIHYRLDADFKLLTCSLAPYLSPTDHILSGDSQVLSLPGVLWVRQYQLLDHIPLCRPVDLASSPLLNYEFLSFLFHGCHIIFYLSENVKDSLLKLSFPCIVCFFQVTFCLFGVASAVEALLRVLIIFGLGNWKLMGSPEFVGGTYWLPVLLYNLHRTVVLKFGCTLETHGEL